MSPRATTLLIALAITAWEGAYAETNEFAYLGPQPGSYTLSTTPGPEQASATTNVDWFGSTSWWQWSRLTGSWGKLRPELEARGLVFGGRFTTDTSAALSSGVSHQWIQQGLLDLNLTFNPEPLLGIHDGLFFAQYFYRYGPNASETVCDLQGFDNISAPPLNQAEEIWYEQKFIAQHLRIKVGQVDANAEFDNLSAAAGFINSSAGHSPALFNMPTYPNPALSLNVFAYPTEWLYCGAGAYAENLRDISAYGFTHPYLIGEIGCTHPGRGRLGPGRLAAGFWMVTAAVDQFDGTTQNGTSGYYMLAQQQIWKLKPGVTDDGRGISIFAQYGSANPAVSPVGSQVGLGISAIGMMPNRERDGMGIYWTWAGLSRACGTDFANDESALEGFYQCQLTPFFALKPDLQWICHPSGTPAPATAFCGSSWISKLTTPRSVVFWKGD